MVERWAQLSQVSDWDSPILFNICCTLFRLQNLQEDSEDSTENQSPEENKVTEEDKIKTTVEEETKSDQ